jgi:hypothetical protein
MEKCPHRHCYAPDTSCALGHTNLSRCPEWKGEAPNETATSAITDSILLPWSGGALGLADVGFVAGRAKPIIVGILGPHSAGKTTLLGSWYLLLGSGQLKGVGQKFAGSYSLEGWEAVAASLRWSPGQKPTFPPHTTSRSGRAPGLLHLAFRQQNNQLRDFLFTDAPGEWFHKWAVNAGAEEAEGARWISEHADILLVIADREALSGQSLGSARNAFQLLATRVAAERRNRPVALVWSKADCQVDGEMATTIREAVTGPMPDALEFSVSIYSEDDSETGIGLLELFQWVSKACRPGVDLPPPALHGNDYLFALGRR